MSQDPEDKSCHKPVRVVQDIAGPAITYYKILGCSIYQLVEVMKAAKMMEAAKMKETEATVEVEGLSTEEVRQWWGIANTATHVATIIRATTAA